MTAPPPTVALIIVAYHHAAHLPATFAALRRLDPATDHQIILVENGDGDSAAVARHDAEITILEPGRNLGFAGGCNYAVAQTQAEIVVLINPDVQPRPNFVRNLVAPLADPQVGIVGAKLLYPDGHTLQHAGGYLEPPLMLAQHHGYGERDTGQYDTPRPVEFVTGAAVAARRTAWLELGGLDEAFYPAYYEEVDLAWRVRRRGLQVRYEPSAVALHQEAAGLGMHSELYYRLYHRNRLRLIFKHMSNAWLLRTWLPAELAHLRATANDAEIAGLFDAYLFWQAAFSYEIDGAPGTEHFADTRLDHGKPAPSSELEWTLGQVQAKRMIAPLAFRSRWPLVAGLRRWINRAATEEYLRPLLQQQNDYNAAVAELAAALARQRRATDAAIACQGMVLARLLNTRRNVDQAEL